MRIARPASEPGYLEDFARRRWGPTGFCCPHCGHDTAIRLRTRPRVRQCRRCRRQTSVTSGTLLHGSHLPVGVWYQRGATQQYRPAQVPSARALARDLGIAVSTAWHLNQRMFLLSDAANPEVPGPTALVHTVRVRRPRPGPPFAATAPAHVRRLHDDHRQGRIHPVDVPLVFHVGDRCLALGLTAPTRDVAREAETHLPDAIQIHDHRGFARYLWAGVVHAPRTVSLRWLPRWVAALLTAWNRHLGTEPPAWQDVAVRCGRTPLCDLDPWRTDYGARPSLPRPR